MNSHIQPETPAAVWRRFAIWSVLVLIGLLALDRFGRYSGLILLAWALGTVVASSIILFRQRD